LTVAEPGVLANVPAAHVGHAVHETALVALLKLPLAHAVHVRSNWAVPWTAT